MSEEIGKYNLFNMRHLPRKIEKQLGIMRYSDIEEEVKEV